MRTSLSKITQPPGNRHKRPGKVSGRRVIHRAMRSYGRLGAAEAVDQTFLKQIFARLSQFRRVKALTFGGLYLSCARGGPEIEL